MISSAFGINKHEQIFLRLRKIAQALRASANLRVLIYSKLHEKNHLITCCVLEVRENAS